jgi:hypothetical protein
MAKKIQLQHILPTRFRLRRETLSNLGVHVLTSNWKSEADDLATRLSGTKKRAKTGFFNQALLALSPVLVHGIKYAGMEDNFALHQMLALEKYPGEALVKSLARHWADVWLEASFANHKASESRKLYELIEDTGKGWVEKSIQDALSNGKNNIRFSALPSLISAQFVGAGPSIINGREIKWGLIQQGDNGLAVVSEPQSSKDGSFAYLIRFSLQYQPGNLEPWIHTFMVCQRYMDEPFVSGNKERNPTILLRLRKPLHTEWAHGQTLVRLPVWNAERGEGPKFPDGFHTLLDRAQAREIIRDPLMVLNNPLNYRSQGEDNYYILYAEGYKPAHSLGTGFGAQERTEIFRDLENKLSGILNPGNAIPLFKGGIESRALDSWKSTEDKGPIDKTKKRELRLTALRSANSRRPIRILLAFINEDMGKSMYYFLAKRHLGFDVDEALPPDIEIETILIPDALCRPLEFSDDLTMKKSDKKLAAEKKLSEEWQKFLKPYKGTKENHTYAWIELPDGTSDFTSPHNAIRMACVKEGIASQMIKKLRSKYEYLIDMGRYFGVSSAQHDFGRLFNACGDLILRQAGVAGGDTKDSKLTDDYQKAGFTSEEAENLVVVGLTVFRVDSDYYRGRGSINFPVATRILPSGRVEVKIPSICNWTDYFDASLALGEAFIKNQRKASFYIDTPTSFNFIQGILDEHKELPSLLILDAYKLRNMWGSLKVDNLKYGQLAFGGDVIESTSIPNMDIIWLRHHGEGETPQYVATNEVTWTDANDADRIAHASLFKDTDANSSLIHFFSVGRLDNNNKADQAAPRHEDGSAMNFGNQQMLELVPIMNPHGEAALVVTHMLRSSPAWGTGNTVLPYPIHLANKMVEDMIPLMGLEDYGDEET